MFVVLVTYTQPLTQIEAALQAHRDFLARQFEAGVLLLTGRREPRTGGVMLAQAPSKAALEAVLAQDPFAVQQLAIYEVIEFQVTGTAPALAAYKA